LDLYQGLSEPSSKTVQSNEEDEVGVTLFNRQMDGPDSEYRRGELDKIERCFTFGFGDAESGGPELRGAELNRPAGGAESYESWLRRLVGCGDGVESATRKEGL